MIKTTYRRGVSLSPILFLRQGLLLTLNLPSRFSWLASEPQESTCLCLPSIRITRRYHHVQLFSVGSEDATNILSTELPLHPCDKNIFDSVALSLGCLSGGGGGVQLSTSFTGQDPLSLHSVPSLSHCSVHLESLMLVSLPWKSPYQALEHKKSPITSEIIPNFFRPQAYFSRVYCSSNAAFATIKPRNDCFPFKTKFLGGTGMCRIMLVPYYTQPLDTKMWIIRCWQPLGSSYTPCHSSTLQTLKLRDSRLSCSRS